MKNFKNFLKKEGFEESAVDLNYELYSHTNSWIQFLYDTLEKKWKIMYFDFFGSSADKINYEFTDEEILKFYTTYNLSPDNQHKVSKECTISCTDFFSVIGLEINDDFEPFKDGLLINLNYADKLKHFKFEGLSKIGERIINEIDEPHINNSEENIRVSVGIATLVRWIKMFESMGQEWEITVQDGMPFVTPVEE